MTVNELSGDATGISKLLWKEHWRLSAYYLLLFAVLAVIAKIFIYRSEDSSLVIEDWHFPVGVVLVFLVYNIGRAGLMNMVIPIVRDSEASLSLSAFKMPLKRYWKYICLRIVLLLIMTVGTFPLLFPGLYMGIRFYFAETHFFAHPEASVRECLSQSMWMTEGHNTLQILVDWFTLSTVLILGLICCCFGVCLALAFVEFVVVVSYFEVTGEA